MTAGPTRAQAASREVPRTRDAAESRSMQVLRAIFAIVS
jgi:hypothetical protein